MEEKDFYCKEETKKFLIFKLFFQKCYPIFINNEIEDGDYLLQSISIKNEILNNLNNNAVKYNIIYELIGEDNDNDIFYKKILVITDYQEMEAKKILDKFKLNMKLCDNIFEELRIIEDFYTFF
jgi:hypothetical protein